jgi:hypothetical protein
MPRFFNVQSLIVHKLSNSDADDAGQGSLQAGLVNRLYSLERETNRSKVCLEANLLALEASEAWYDYIGRSHRLHSEEDATRKFEAAIRSTNRQLCRLDFILREIGTAMQQVSFCVCVSHLVY